MEIFHKLGEGWSYFTGHLEALLFSTMLAYGYRTIFFGVMLENAGLPVPGETILILGGYFAAKGHFHLGLVMLLAAFGAIIGDNIGFAVGRYFGREFFLRHGRWILLTPKRLEMIDRFFTRHGDKTILVARFITGLRVFAALFAGTSQMRWRSFGFYNAAGAMIWAVAIATLGYVFAPSLQLLERWVGRSGAIFLVVAVVGALIVWKIQHRRQRRAAEMLIEVSPKVES
jgi:membrane protein DedA with SNARE-associated domain